MELTITDIAADKIKDINSNDDKYLWLFYDTVDCGCGVNGVPTLRLTNTTDDSFKQVSNHQFNVIVHEQQATFFAEKMKLDFVANNFRLTSPEGVLNPIIPQTHLTKGEEDE